MPLPGFCNAHCCLRAGCLRDRNTTGGNGRLIPGNQPAFRNHQRDVHQRPNPQHGRTASRHANPGRRRPDSGCYPNRRGQRHADRCAILYGNGIADRNAVVHGPSSITD